MTNHTKELILSVRDFIFERIRSSKMVNTLANSCRVTHYASGVKAVGSGYYSYGSNVELALHELRSLNEFTSWIEKELNSRTQKYRNITIKIYNGDSPSINYYGERI